jgi:hypothetical protein
MLLPRLARLRSVALWLSAGTLVIAITVACNSTAIDAEAAGGTPAPDGADGYCCPARTGGCALTGGYRESGECPKDFDICDNMCDQRIVKDEHGCDVLAYKGCSGSFNGGDRPDAGDAGDAGDATVDSAPDAGTDSAPE